MKTKTIDGKEYIEYDRAKVENRKAIINAAFLILLFVAILALFFAILTIVKNKEMLNQQPIDYVMEKYDFETCTCFDKTGKVFGSGYTPITIDYSTEVDG